MKSLTNQVNLAIQLMVLYQLTKNSRHTETSKMWTTPISKALHIRICISRGTINLEEVIQKSSQPRYSAQDCLSTDQKGWTYGCRPINGRRPNEPYCQCQNDIFSNMHLKRNH